MNTVFTILSNTDLPTTIITFSSFHFVHSTEEYTNLLIYKIKYTVCCLLWLIGNCKLIENESYAPLQSFERREKGTNDTITKKQKNHNHIIIEYIL